ncbi:AAA family ATPase [Pantoea eucrina]|uniref:AAA family ATPase n=1 Tax=Pantoea eucrina TaxID=472693 RepID=UPI00080F5746|nr:AAA family ATPase [Pantoea eucrina]
MSQTQVNDNLVLIVGASAGGKSASLRGLKNQTGVMYLNCEAGKKLPFPNKFQSFTITDPYQIFEAFDHAETDADIHTIVIDTATFMMDMFESVHVLTSANTMQAWGAYNQFFKQLMQDKVAKSTKNVIILAHSLATYNEADMVIETKVPVKGALKNQGMEAYFSCVVAAKKVAIKDLKDYGSDLLEITPEEEALGFKYVFQTKLTKATVNERIRSPMGLFTTKQTFMDNDAQLLLEHVNAYYHAA